MDEEKSVNIDIFNEKRTMNSTQGFNHLYDDVSRNIAQTLEGIAELKVDNKEGKIHLDSMTKELAKLQERFNERLNFLEKNSEWDKFTLAFFGETNAGKSTVIESLRIIFSEEYRQQFLEKNNNDLAKAEVELTSAAEQFYTDLGKIYKKISESVAGFSFSVTRLTQIIENESTFRLKMETNERRDRQEKERMESAVRLQIMQKESFAKIKLKVTGATIIGLVIGAGVMRLVSILGWF